MTDTIEYRVAVPEGRRANFVYHCERIGCDAVVVDTSSGEGEIIADGGRLATPASDEQATIIDTLADSGPAGISELALAAEVGRSYGAVTAALGTLEDGGLVEQVGGDSPQWRLVEDAEVAEV